LLGRDTIPYDLEERRDVLRDAYEELDEYVRRWTALREAGA
jgi:hypothetical protein